MEWYPLELEYAYAGFVVTRDALMGHSDHTCDSHGRGAHFTSPTTTTKLAAASGRRRTRCERQGQQHWPARGVRNVSLDPRSRAIQLAEIFIEVARGVAEA